MKVRIDYNSIFSTRDGRVWLYSLISIVVVTVLFLLPWWVFPLVGLKLVLAYGWWRKLIVISW